MIKLVNYQNDDENNNFDVNNNCNYDKKMITFP